MADIAKANTSADIKNGTLVVSCTRTGNYDVLNTYVNNKPILADIESKYAARFDDPSYYYGDGTQGT
jgi:hypothetical protein